MLLPLDEFRAQLINDLVFAGTQKEVHRIIDISVDALKLNKVNPHVISRFIDRVIGELGLFNPISKDVRQWSNIKLARILLMRLRGQLNARIV
jgi:hypothetical protein